MILLGVCNNYTCLSINSAGRSVLVHICQFVACCVHKMSCYPNLCGMSHLLCIRGGMPFEPDWANNNVDSVTSSPMQLTTRMPPVWTDVFQSRQFIRPIGDFLCIRTPNTGQLNPLFHTFAEFRPIVNRVVVRQSTDLLAANAQCLKQNVYCAKEVFIKDNWVFPKWKTNSVNSGNLENHWSIKWGQFKDLFWYLCLHAWCCGIISVSHARGCFFLQRYLKIL